MARTTDAPGCHGAGLRRLIALTLLAGLVLAGGSKARQDELRYRAALGAARQENRTLHLRQEALREQLFEASRRLRALELGGFTDAQRSWREAGPEGGRGLT